MVARVGVRGDDVLAHRAHRVIDVDVGDGVHGQVGASAVDDQTESEQDHHRATVNLPPPRRIGRGTYDDRRRRVNSRHGRRQRQPAHGHAGPPHGAGIGCSMRIAGRNIAPIRGRRDTRPSVQSLCLPAPRAQAARAVRGERNPRYWTCVYFPGQRSEHRPMHPPVRKRHGECICSGSWMPPAQ